MDASFVDLDILLTNIRNPQSRIYFSDAVKAYKAGALRGSLTSAWVALAYDLIAKYRELSADGDVAAATFLQGWDHATLHNDIGQLLHLERKIIEDATDNTQVINQIARTHLERLREDRHLCAHPAFSAEAQLFEPSAELVRLHLVNAVELVLSQEPRQGRAIFDLYGADVQSPGFPSDHGRVLDYVEQRYLARVRVPNIRNFGTVLAKSLLKGIPPELDAVHAKVASSLVAIRDRAPGSWPEVSPAIVRLIDNLDPPNRPRAIAFIASFPAFWPLLQEATRTALEQTVNNATADNLDDVRILRGVSFTNFRAPLLAVIAALDRNTLVEGIAAAPLPELWAAAADRYGNSGSYRGSAANFSELIAPFTGMLGPAELDQLFQAIIDNGQNYAAAETPTLLVTLLRNGAPGQVPTVNVRDRFYRRMRRMRQLDRYAVILEIFTGDGWAPGPADDEDDDD